MRLGLIGLGRIGAFHARTLAALPEACTASLHAHRPVRMEEVRAAPLRSTAHR